MITWLLHQNYYSIIDHLKKKYGEVPYDYFTEKGFIEKRNKKAYLEIHHVYEFEKALYRTLRKFGSNMYTNSWFHRKEHLVYCNHLEHLVLHVKIYEHKNSGLKTLTKYMIPRIVDYLSGAPKEYFATWDAKHIFNTFEHYGGRYIVKELEQILEYIFKNTNIKPNDMKLSYLETYGSERFKNGLKVHAINDWKFENNKYIFQKIIDIYKNSV